MKLFRRSITLLVVLYSLIMVASAIVVHFYGDKSELGTLALFSPRHLMVWPWVLLVPLSWVASRWIGLTAVGGLMVWAFGVASWELPWPSPAASPDDLRVVFYNTDASKTLGGRISADIDAWDADVMALVDCRSDVEDIMRAKPGYTFVPMHFGCFMSRYPVVSSKRMPPSPIDVARTPGAGRAGRVHRVSLDVNGTLATVYILHMESPRDALAQARYLDFSRLYDNTIFRSIDSQVASRFVDRDAPGLMVLGDFNLTIESTIYQRDWGDFTNAFSAVGTGFGHTMFAGWHRVRIDHVLAGEQWQPVSARVLRGYPSEHQPVVVELTRGG